MELISREEAMRLLKEDYDASRSREDDERAEACLLHFIEISNLPTVEERNVGEWLDNGDRYYRCSLCGMKDTDNWKFCRGCGAYMKGE